MSFSGDVNPRVAPRIRISQSVFDDAVRVNMEEFDMPLSEALADALREFEQSGSDLSGVITDGTDTNLLPIIIALRALKDTTPVDTAAEDPTPDGLLAASDARATDALLAVTSALLAGTSVDTGRTRALARSHGGVTTISAALEAAAGSCGIYATRVGSLPPVFVPAMASRLTASFTALRAVCAGYDDARLEVTTDIVRIVALVVATAATASETTTADSNNNNTTQDDAEIIHTIPPPSLTRAALLLGTTLATKREDAKAELFKTAALPQTLAALLRRALSAPDGSPRADTARMLARDAAVLLSRILSDDDMRAQSSHAYEFACLAAGRTGNTGSLPSRAPRVPFVGARASAARAQAMNPLGGSGGGGGGGGVVSSAASIVSDGGTGIPLQSQGTGVPQPPSVTEGGGGASTVGGGAVDDDDDNDSNGTALIPLLLAAAERWAAHM
jgi:hypothetical protein